MQAESSDSYGSDQDLSARAKFNQVSEDVRKNQIPARLDRSTVSGFEFQNMKIRVPRYFNPQVFDKVLSELEPVCFEEQDFCVKFFHLATEAQVMDVTEMLVGANSTVIHQASLDLNF